MGATVGSTKVSSIGFVTAFDICFMSPQFILLIHIFLGWFVGVRVVEEKHGSTLHRWFVDDAKV